MSKKAILNLLLVACFLISSVAECRVGGGRSFGSRGSRGMSMPRSYSAPSSRSFGNSYSGTQHSGPQQPRPSQPYQTGSQSNSSAAYNSIPPIQSSRPSMWKTFGAGLAGGFLGSMLFRSLGMGPSLHAMPGGGAMSSGGIGILEVLVIGALIFLVFRLLIQKAAARSMPDSQAGMYSGKTYDSEPAYNTGSGSSISSSGSGLGAGLGSSGSGAEELMRQAKAERTYSNQNDSSGMDNVRDIRNASRSEIQVEPIPTDTAMDLFFQIQAAWMNRDLNSVHTVLDYDARDYLEHELSRLKTRGLINRLENIAIRNTEVLESWQEGNRNYATVRFLANLLDYTVDDRTQQVVEGSKTQPVKFEEFWTFSKNVFDSQWKLSAIQQPE